jgi:DNA-3-methyladenine glycosylase II
VPAETFSLTPRGPFNLATEQAHFGGWPEVDGNPVMAFPLEDRRTAAAVVLRQEGKAVHGEVFGAGRDAERAWRQALATVSLDVDGGGFQYVARRDEVIRRLWKEHGSLRPVLFHSPYEAAAAFVIGHRITITQTRKIRQHMAEEMGAAVEVRGRRFHAFPDPRTLLRLEGFPSVPANKIERLRAVAQASIDGWLQREHLRSLPEDDALSRLRTLPGIGEFFAQGILSRGAGLADFITDDDLTPRAVQLAYGLKERPSRARVLEVAEAWRPYRMWALVLLHVWLRRQPKSVIGPRQLGRGATGAQSAAPGRTGGRGRRPAPG